MIGEFSISNPRFGFVKNEKEKYFVLAKNSMNAHDMDKVEFVTYEYNKKMEAKITKIIERYTDEFVGTITVNKNFAFVNVESFPEDVYIKSKHTLKAKSGDLVRIKIHFWGGKGKKAEAKVIKCYGNGANAENIVSSKIEEFGIAHKFSKEILEESDKLEARIGKRVDLRNLHHITIDSEDTRDIDDAIYLEKNGDKYELYVSIADVSSYVREGSKIDEEALKRGNSVYLYNRVIPMLPRRLTNDLCSLNPNQDKLAFTVNITYDKNAKVIKHDIFKSLIISKNRLSYNQVNDIIDNNIEDYEHSKMIFDMQELSLKLSELSKKRGSIEFEIPEIKLDLDDNSKLKEIKLRNRSNAEVLIENFMVAANEQVAIYMNHNNLPSIYRIHENPTYESMEELNREIRPLGLSVKNPENLMNRLQSIIEKTNYAIHKLVLRSMQKAIYSRENKGHFGLSLDNYLHFTSPIRRYSDLIVHRILSDAIERYIPEKEANKINKKLKPIATHISSTERQAQKLEYLARDIKIAEYMEEYIGTEYKATVTSIYNERVYVTLDNYAEAVLIGIGQYEISDNLTVVLKEVDKLKGKLFVERI